MRSRIAIQLRNGRRIEGWADERYRGGPENPLSNAELEAKVRSCCHGILDAEGQTTLIDTAWSVVQLGDATKLAEIINGSSKAKT
jgi:hypothetical protein